MDDILRVLQLGSGSGGSGGRHAGNSNSAAAEDDGIMFSHEAFDFATAADKETAAGFSATDAGCEQQRPRISFANALPPRPPAGEAVRQSPALLGR